MGANAPVNRDRIVAISEDGPAVDLGRGRFLEAFYAPGHAKHQMALLDSAGGELFVGDALGVRVPDAGTVRPAAPPPEFDLELVVSTAARLHALGAEGVFPSHFGPAPDVDQIFDEAPRPFIQWVEAAEKVVAAGRPGGDDGGLPGPPGRVLPGASAEMVAKFEYSCSYDLNARGILRYLQRRA